MIYLATSQSIPGKSGALLMTRVLGANAVPMVQADISTITYTVTDLTTGLAVVSAVSVTISSTIFNLLQNDLPWQLATGETTTNLGADGLVGYNFKFVLPATALVPSGDRFQVDFLFTPASGQPFVVSFMLPTIKEYVW